MTKYTKIVAALGVAAGLGIASLPAAGVFAADPTSDVEVEVKIANTISLNVDAAKVSVNMLQGETKTLSTTANVATNNSKGWSLFVKDADSNTSLVSGTDVFEAALTDATAGDAKGNWYLTVAGTDFAISATDKKIATSATPTTSAGVDTAVTYNIHADDAQAAGTYSDVVTYTAQANA